MSNNRDYTRYSKENANLTEDVELVEVVEETAEETAEVIEEPMVEEPTIDESKHISGVVVDCVKLNVREQPNPNADILGIINEGSEVLVNEEESTDDFYKICTSAGLEGYCMRKFVSIMP